jgi:hypothetical protein
MRKLAQHKSTKTKAGFDYSNFNPASKKQTCQISGKKLLSHAQQHGFYICHPLFIDNQRFARLD